MKGNSMLSEPSINTKMGTLPYWVRLFCWCCLAIRTSSNTSPSFMQESIWGYLLLNAEKFPSQNKHPTRKHFETEMIYRTGREQRDTCKKSRMYFHSMEIDTEFTSQNRSEWKWRIISYLRRQIDWAHQNHRPNEAECGTADESTERNKTGQIYHSKMENSCL